MVKTNNKMKGAVAGTLAAVLLIGGTMAYFTDHAEMEASGKAGTMAIEATSHINLLDADGLNIINPGDVRTVKFDVENTGNKSADLQTLITLTSDVAMTTDANGQAQYELYKADEVSTIEGVGTIPVVFSEDFAFDGKTGEEAIKAAAVAYVTEGSIVAEAGTATVSEPLSVREISEDGKVITYAVPDRVLDGDAALGEFEDEAEAETNGTTYDYVMVMNSNAKNEFQESNVDIDVQIKAKQHRNTEEVGWQLVEADF